MKQTITRSQWDPETKKYSSVVVAEVDMTDARGVILEVGQKVVYAKAGRNGPAMIEEAVIHGLGDGYVVLDFQKGKKVRLWSSTWQTNATAQFSQIYVL